MMHLFLMRFNYRERSPCFNLQIKAMDRLLYFFFFMKKKAVKVYIYVFRYAKGGGGCVREQLARPFTKVGTAN